MYGTTEFEKFSNRGKKNFDDSNAYRKDNRKRNKKKPRPRHQDKRNKVFSKHEERDY